MEYTMNEMVKYIGVSNTTLKRYEKNGLIPPVSYTQGKHRRYDDIHLSAFKTVRKLMQGFDVSAVYQLMFYAGKKEFTEAHWIIASAAEELVQKKKTLEVHKDFILNFPEKTIRQKNMRIGELAAYAGIESSTIRYWEERGLIRSEREAGSGYRLFDKDEVRKTIIVSLLRKSVYKIEEIKKIMSTLDSENLTSIKNHYTAVNRELDIHLKRQLEGVSLYMKYCADISSGKF
ncbi:MerR family transcriptional regulator [Corticicoccus populi]|uniref:MerR family transcriptional regulator n=1 Tax=Corticicoccus populi TaxID=1812821 RepID=A0ABW5WY01_9STAP